MFCLDRFSVDITWNCAYYDWTFLGSYEPILYDLEGGHFRTLSEMNEDYLIAIL